MKTQKQDHYDFSQSSPSGQPGFEVFEDAKNKCWRFHGHTVENQAALFSQPYATAESAQRGLQATIRLLKKKRARIQEVPGGWQLVIQSGNHQELARSPVFSQKEQVAKLMQYFLNVATSAKPVTVPTPAAAVREMQPEPGDAQSDAPVRHAFRLYFYPSEKNQGFTGRIENINNPAEKASFQGIDKEAILNFLRQQLIPENKTSSQAETAGAPGADPVPALITPGPSSSVIVSRNQRGTTVDLILVPERSFPSEGPYTIENSTVTLRHMDSGEQTTLCPSAIQQLGQGQIKLHLDTNALPIGAYHLNASVWFSQAQEDKICVKGTGWLQLL